MIFEKLKKRLVDRLIFNGSPTLKRRVADSIARSTEEITYRRLVENGYVPKAIIDVGAFRGDWTRKALEIFGEMPVLMVEAQPDLEPGLQALCQQIPAADYELALLGAEAGKDVTFYQMGTGSSFLPETSDAPRRELSMKTTTLDMVVAEKLREAENIFLKIDVQGAELEVLKGAPETLKKCSLIQLETALLQYNEGAPLIRDVVDKMADLGFFVTEVSGFSRPRNHLVQIDLLFAGADSVLRPKFFNF